jgi:hypothetical protein
VWYHCDNHLMTVALTGAGGGRGLDYLRDPVFVGMFDDNPRFAWLGGVEEADEPALAL